jgi:hypothetical protein
MDFHLVTNGTDETQPLLYQWEIMMRVRASCLVDMLVKLELAVVDRGTITFET